MDEDIFMSEFDDDGPQKASPDASPKNVDTGLVSGPDQPPVKKAESESKPRMAPGRDVDYCRFVETPGTHFPVDFHLGAAFDQKIFMDSLEKACQNPIFQKERALFAEWKDLAARLFHVPTDVFDNKAGMSEVAESVAASLEQAHEEERAQRESKFREHKPLRISERTGRPVREESPKVGGGSASVHL
jgi:hypothetical protein